MTSLSELQRSRRKRWIFWILVYVVLVAASFFSARWVLHRLDRDVVLEGNVELAVPKARFAVGEDVSFTMKNDLETSIFIINGCPKEPLHVFRWNGKTWDAVHATTTKSYCEGQSRMIEIPAKRSVTYSYRAWPELFAQPGYYRIVASVEQYVKYPYADFEIYAPGVSTSPTAAPQGAPVLQQEPANVVVPQPGEDASEQGEIESVENER